MTYDNENEILFIFYSNKNIIVINKYNYKYMISF